MVHLWISWLAAWVSSQFKGKESCRTRDSNEQWLHYFRIPLLKRLVVYGFISLSMHDLLGFEGFIPTRHGCYYDGKQNKGGKSQKAQNVLSVIFKFGSTFYQSLPRCSWQCVQGDPAPEAAEWVLHQQYPTSEDIQFAHWIGNRNEIINAIELESLEQKSNFKSEIRTLL